MVSRGSFDIVIKNGKIVDGTGNPWFKGSIGIKDEIISKVTRSDNIEGERVIDAKGLVVAPGIIDIHSHTDFTITENNMVKNKLFQGVTTDVVGNCGQSTYGFREELKDKVSNWLSLRFFSQRSSFVFSTEYSGENILKVY